VDDLSGAPLARLVITAAAILHGHWQDYLGRRWGLTPAGLRVLMLLNLGEMRHRELADRCYIRPATLTGVVDTLVKAGHVERLSDPRDRRSVRLVLTESGRRVHDEVAELMHNAPPLTSVDADRANEKIIREFLLEIIRTREEDNRDNGGGGPRPGEAVPEE
jgi:DNA-binding MarR family transcriptional regulator